MAPSVHSLNSFLACSDSIEVEVEVEASEEVVVRAAVLSKSEIFVRLGLVLSILLITSCGDSVNNLGNPTPLSNGDVVFPQNPSNPNGGSNNPQSPNQGNISQAAWNQIKGRWRGVLEDFPYSQNFQMEITERTFSGQTWGYMTFSSTGNAGNIQFEAILGLYGTVFLSSGAGGYQFFTNLMDIPSLSVSTIAFEFIPAFQISGNGNLTLDPTQSQLFAWDCGFSQSFCSSRLSEPSFGSLEKVSVSP